MDAKISYKMACIPHPWDAKQRKSGITAWCLVKIIQPQYGNVTTEPIAIFNLDSEAETFQGHVHAAGQDGSLVEIDSDLRERFGMRARRI